MNDAEAVRLGHFLSQWLAKRTSAGEAKKIAQAISFNDSPIFGARKKRGRLFSELVMVNAAIIISAVNLALGYAEAKRVIDEFLKTSRPLFQVVEKAIPQFPQLYEKRLQSYFGILAGENAGLGVSLAFMNNLEVAHSLEAQLSLVSEFGASRTVVYETVKERAESLAPKPSGRRPDITEEEAFDAVDAFVEALDRFNEEARDWPDEHRTQALKAVYLFTDGKGAEAKAMVLQLPRAYALAAMRLIRAWVK